MRHQLRLIFSRVHTVAASQVLLRMRRMPLWVPFPIFLLWWTHQNVVGIATLYVWTAITDTSFQPFCLCQIVWFWDIIQSFALLPLSTICHCTVLIASSRNMAPFKSESVQLYMMPSLFPEPVLMLLQLLPYNHVNQFWSYQFSAAMILSRRQVC